MSYWPAIIAAYLAGVATLPVLFVVILWIGDRRNEAERRARPWYKRSLHADDERIMPPEDD